MIPIAILSVLLVASLASILFVISRTRQQLVESYMYGRLDQVEIERIVATIEIDDPSLFAAEVEQLLAEQLSQRFESVLETTIVESDGSERQVSPWDGSSRLGFYRFERDN